MSTTIQFSSADGSLFQFPPKNDPRTLPPPSVGSTTSAPPFEIPSWLYHGALDVRVPLTIAFVYATTVTYLNRYNRSRGNKPWSISKTQGFKWFVVVHNVFLAIYSGWTFVEMFGTLNRSVRSPYGPDGLVGTVDSLCKIHGTQGLGNAVVYNPSATAWVSQSPATITLNGQTPNPEDLGRIWNEGLAFVGWFFYLSKFYEVLDTAIILAKGKRSGTLQTYHHAGAMMCMWAGIRFMSPPIWMFAFVNSGIHTLMYTYYTLTAFSIRVPGPIKRSLTMMQITQFLVGASYAALHSFVSYTVPVQVADVSGSLASAASATVSNVAAAATSAGTANLLKKLLFRAAGEGGLAENVNSKRQASNNYNSGSKSSNEASYHTEERTISCIDTSGQTFAIWLNVLYLAPLTFLFVRFFVKTYIIPSRSQKRITAAKAGKDALKGVERQIFEHPASANGKTVKGNGHAKPTRY